MIFSPQLEINGSKICKGLYHLIGETKTKISVSFFSWKQTETYTGSTYSSIRNASFPLSGMVRSGILSFSVIKWAH